MTIPATLTCEGQVIFTYRYTACDGVTTDDWTYTYGSPQPHAPSLIGDRAYSYDLNLKELRQRYPQIVASGKVSARIGSGIESLRELIRTQAWELPLMGTFWPS